jgi:hypothetical protein
MYQVASTSLTCVTADRGSADWRDGPGAPTARLRWCRLLRTHFCSLMGSPAVSGSTNASSVRSHAGSLFLHEDVPRKASRTRSCGRSASPVSSSCRPRWIVLGSMPVMCDSTSSPPGPTRSDSMATYQRRCCSSNRLTKRLIRRCRAGRDAAFPGFQIGHSLWWIFNAPLTFSALHFND